MRCLFPITSYVQVPGWLCEAAEAWPEVKVRLIGSDGDTEFYLVSGLRADIEDFMEEECDAGTDWVTQVSRRLIAEE